MGEDKDEEKEEEGEEKEEEEEEKEEEETEEKEEESEEKEGEKENKVEEEEKKVEEAAQEKPENDSKEDVSTVEVAKAEAENIRATARHNVKVMKRLGKLEGSQGKILAGVEELKKELL